MILASDDFAKQSEHPALTYHAIVKYIGRALQKSVSSFPAIIQVPPATRQLDLSFTTDSYNP
jgi:hypothetical protein